MLYHVRLAGFTLSHLNKVLRHAPIMDFKAHLGAILVVAIGVLVATWIVIPVANKARAAVGV